MEETGKKLDQPDYIYKVVARYTAIRTDEDGETVTANIEERLLISGEAHEFARFVAPGQLVLVSQVGPFPWQFEVPLYNASTPEEAFDQLDAALEAQAEIEKPKAQKKLMEAMEEMSRKIMPASSVPPAVLRGGKLPPGIQRAR